MIHQTTIKKLKALFWPLVLILVIAQTAYAIGITVDGVRESAWDGNGDQTPGKSLDANEGAIDDGSDIKVFEWTNDPTYLYLGFETYTNTIWSSFLGTRLDFCLNTDKDTNTGFSYPNCNGMTGIDRFIRITPGTGNNLTVQIYDGNQTLIPTATVSGMYSGAYSEVSIDLASLGMTSASVCDGTIDGVIYFDGGTTNPDDNTPDSGFMPFTCGSPSAVTLQNSTAGDPLANPLNLLWSAVLSLAAASGIILVRRRFKKIPA